MKKVIQPVKLFPRRSSRRVSTEETDVSGVPPDSINPVYASYEDPEEPNKLPDLIKETDDRSQKDEGENDTTSNPTGPGQDLRITQKDWDELKKEAEGGEGGEAAEAGEAAEVLNEGQNLVEQNQVLNEDQDFNYGGDLAGGFSVDQSLILIENFTRLAEVVGKILTSQKKAATPSSGPLPSEVSPSFNSHQQLPQLDLCPQKLALELYLEPRYLRPSSLSSISLKKKNKKKFIDRDLQFLSANDCL